MIATIIAIGINAPNRPATTTPPIKNITPKTINNKLIIISTPFFSL